MIGKILASLLSFFLGFGSVKFVLLILGLVFLFASLFCRFSFAQKTSGIHYGLIALSAIFFLVYWALYVPYFPDLFVIEEHYFKKLFVLSSAVLFLPFLLLGDEKSVLEMVFYFAFGAFVFAVLTVCSTVILTQPPYYGKIVDLRFLVRGQVVYGNSPGVANLLTMVPIVLLGMLLLPERLRPKRFKWIMWFGMLISIACAVALQQRSFFIVGLLIQPVLVALLMLYMGQYRKFVAIASFVLLYPLVVFVDGYFGVGLFYRKLNYDILSDARFELIVHWIKEMLANPMLRHPIPDRWNFLAHYHSFFADIERVSGFWAMLAAIVLFVYIFIRIFMLATNDKAAGSFLLVVVVPTMFIMMTSVVPEGEKQPFLLVLLAATCCERILWNKRKKLH